MEHVSARKRPNQKVSRRQPWDPVEKQIVLKTFRIHIKNNSLPGKVECEKCIQDNPVLSKRIWTDLKFFVKNHISKIKKIKN